MVTLAVGWNRALLLNKRWRSLSRSCSYFECGGKLFSISDLITRKVSNYFWLLKLLPILIGPGDFLLRSGQPEDGSRR